MENNWISLLQNQNQLSKVIETNQYTEQFGLTLSQQDAQLILDNRKDELKVQRRVEFGEGLRQKLFVSFATQIILIRIIMLIQLFDCRRFFTYIKMR